MNRKKTNLEVNDYLDLYLLSGSLGDKSWQQEVIGRLKDSQNEMTIQDSSLIIHNLWIEYKKVNTDILEMYNQLRTDSSSEELNEKIWNLKQQRMSLSRKIHFKDSDTQHYNS